MCGDGGRGGALSIWREEKYDVGSLSSMKTFVYLNDGKRQR
jgi:hypothetical protein